MPISEVAKVSGRHQGNFGQRKRKIMLNYCNLKSFKKKYQLVESFVYGHLEFSDRRDIKVQARANK